MLYCHVKEKEHPVKGFLFYLSGVSLHMISYSYSDFMHENKQTMPCFIKMQ